MQILESNELYPHPILPDNLHTYIKGQACCCILRPDETEAFSIALDLFNEYVLQNPLPEGSVCNIIYTESLDIILRNNDSTPGFSLSLAVIYLNIFRADSRYGNIILLLALLEELIHSLYLVRDEWEVKEIALTIARRKFPELKLHPWFPDMFDENDRRIVS